MASDVRRPRGDCGFTIIEIMIVLVILGSLAAIAIPVYSNALEKSRRAALAQDLAVLHRAFLRYYADHGSFPAEGDFDKVSFAPLTDGDYFKADSVSGKLMNGQALSYFAPDIEGVDSDFILVARAKHDPNLWAYVISYDWSLDVGGYDGVYFWVDGQFVQVN